VARRDRVRWREVARGLSLELLIGALNERLSQLGRLMTGIIVRANSGTTDYERTRLNIIEGDNVTVTVTDDAASDEIDITIAASGGDSTPIGTRFERVVEGWEWGSGNAGVWVTSGMPSMSAAGSTTSGDDTDGMAITMTTGAVIGNNCFRRTTSNYFLRYATPIYYCRLKTGADVTSYGFMAGFSNSAISSLGSGSDPGNHSAVFRYHTGADGTAFWRTVTKDGSTLETTVTTVPFTASTLYELSVEMDLTEVRFYINSTLVSTHTVRLPLSTTPLQAGWCITTLAASTRTFRVYHHAYRCLS
jgi:hypothetical protein